MAVISISLNDTASEGLNRLNDEVANVARSTDELIHSTDQLAATEERQLTVIHQHRAGLSAVAVSMSNVGVEVVKFVGGLAVLIERQRMVAAGQTLLAKTSDEVTSILARQAAQWGLVEATSGTAYSGLTAGAARATPVIAGLTAGFMAYEAIMARTGQRTDEFGKVTSNLDRVKEAASGLGRDVAAPFGILIDQVKEYASNLNPLPTIWREIDASATRTADQQIINIKILRDQLNGGTSELEEYHARLDKLREREAAGFEAIRRVNQILTEQENERARQAEIASIKTIEGIESEIRKVREKAATEAQRGTSALQIEQTLLAELSAIERQRTTIHDREAQRRAEIDRIVAARNAELERGNEVARKARYDKITAEADKELEKLREIRKKEAAQEEEYYAAVDRSREAFHQSALAAEYALRDKELAAQKDAAQKAIATEKEKQDRLKALRADAVQKAGINGQALLNQADPRQVQRLLAERAGQQARQRAAAENSGLFREAQFDSDGPARKKYDRLLNQAQKDAELQARQQFARGQSDPQQLAQAQAQVAGNQLQALNRAGKLTDTSLQAINETLQGVVNVAATQQAQQRQIDQLTREAASVNAATRSQRQTARAQNGSL